MARAQAAAKAVSGDAAAAGGSDPEVDLSAFEPAMRRAAEYVLDPSTSLAVLPASVTDVMALANSGEAQFRDVDRVVRQDPVIAARVLSVANSPLYRPPSPLTSLRMALIRLGWNILREILLQTVAEAHLLRRGPRRESAEARLHAIVLAHVHRHVAQVIGFDTEHAFACGLLHDLGRPIMLDMLSRKEAPPLDAIARHSLIASLHGIVGARAATAWKLPEVVARVCRDHHATSDSPEMSMSGVSTVAICEALVTSHGFASAPELDAVVAEHQVARLGLPSHELESLRSTIELLCSDIR